MAKVFNPPANIKVPDFNFRDLEGSRKAEQAYIESIQNYARIANRGSDFAGELITIPHADGKAYYVVFGLKPVELIHLPIGDAWDSPLAHRMTAKDIKQRIMADNMLRMFVNKNNENKS